MNKNNVADGLKAVLANSYALYLKTQNYHWNVKSPNFKSLHELFETQYDDLAEAIDEIAERIRALDVSVPASFDIFKKNSKIQDGNEENNAQTMVKELYQDNQMIVEIITSTLKLAQESGDEATADLMIKRTEVHQKNAWMLKSSM